MYDNNKMKPIKIIVKKRVMEGMKLIKMHSLHVWEYHNKPLVHLMCANKKEEKEVS
jgi:trehalose utilization protein